MTIYPLVTCIMRLAMQYLNVGVCVASDHSTKIASVVHIGSSNDVFQHSCPVIHLQRTSKIGTHRQGSINRRLCVKNIINHTWESSACV